ncbi:RTA1 like protein-domain-containing protein [Auriculariales sp. MPI-PUGE-AT-0066]|nr:RTA1 like protein-domain-containing protein [Auriculariales sp. MPI-PUGE-AT-0066]
MSSQGSTHSDPNGFKYYHYDPSGTAALLFAVIFAISAALNAYQMARTRTWYSIPFIIAGILSFIGYIGRYISSTQTPDWTLGPYLIQTLLLLVAPALFAATIYMELKRIIALVNGEHLAPIPMRWLTKLFVAGDVLSLLLQAGGGGIMSMDDKDMYELGQKIVVVGLLVQIIFFGLFGVTSIIFHRRVQSQPTALSNYPDLPWRKHIFALYFMSTLILIRSVFRVIEFAQGNDGVLLSKEIYLYIFDTLLMTCVTFTMNTVHPSELDALSHGGLVSRAGGIRYEFVQPVDGKRFGSASELTAMRAAIQA